MPPPGFEPFLETILDNPGDDGPRMVYADWLEEQGDPRAEFIRAQLELAKLTETDSEWQTYADREYELLTAHGGKWRAEIPDFARKDCEFRRGFVTQVSVWTPWDRDYGPELSRLAPVEKLVLHFVAQQMQEFAQYPNVRHLSELAILDDRMEAHDLHVLLNAEVAVNRLSTLQFMGMALLDAGARLFAVCRHLDRLERLELIRCRIGGPGLQEFANRSRLPSLRWLDLSDNDGGTNQANDHGSSLGNEAFWMLLNSPLMVQLNRLHWNDNGLTSRAIQLLAESPKAKNLTHLEIAGNHVSDPGMRILRDEFPKLQWLNVARNPFTTGMAMSLKEVFGNRVRVGMPGESG
jgi:uncharacterized protein (TIGR02996 family)